MTPINKGIETNKASGGIHRASMANIFSWCGTTADGKSVVYKVTVALR